MSNASGGGRGGGHLLVKHVGVVQLLQRRRVAAELRRHLRQHLGVSEVPHRRQHGMPAERLRVGGDVLLQLPDVVGGRAGDELVVRCGAHLTILPGAYNNAPC